MLSSWSWSWSSSSSYFFLITCPSPCKSSLVFSGNTDRQIRRPRLVSHHSQAYNHHIMIHCRHCHHRHQVIVVIMVISSLSSSSSSSPSSSNHLYVQVLPCLPGLPGRCPLPMFARSSSSLGARARQDGSKDFLPGKGFGSIFDDHPDQHHHISKLIITWSSGRMAVRISCLPSVFLSTFDHHDDHPDYHQFLVFRYIIISFYHHISLFFLSAYRIH